MFNIFYYLLEKEKAVTINKDEKVIDVLKKMEFNTLPVVDNDNNYLGVFNKVFVYEKIYKTNLDISDIKVNDLIIKHEPITFNDKLEDIMVRLQNNKYLFLPLINKEKKFEGIILNNKLIKLFGNIISVDHKEITLNVLLKDYEGTLSKLLNILKKYNVNIITLNVMDLELMNTKLVYMKLECNKKYNIDFIKNELKKKGFDCVI